MEDSPLVSCIMPTCNRRRFVPLAIRYFLAQDYSNKELLILDDGDDSIEDLVPDNQQIRYVREPKGRTLGAKRNRLCELGQGDIIAHWDDDDWHAPYRLSYQVSNLLSANAQLCGINRLLFYAPDSHKAWEYVYPRGQRFWLSGSSLCYRRDFWLSHPFPDIAVGEDSRFVWSGDQGKMLTLENYKFHVGIIHGHNTSPKYCKGSWWSPYDVANVVELLGADVKHYNEKAAASTTENALANSPCALVAAANGIGDILRMTPLVRVLARLGYTVDFLAAPDYEETSALIEKSPEINKLFHYPDFGVNRGKLPIPDLKSKTYDVAIFSCWAAPLKRWVQSRRLLEFSKMDWLGEGFYASLQQVGKQLDWQEPLPESFAIDSGRDFNLPPGTVALHPGCKPDWPWKKWHGFDDLARLLGRVVLVGTPEDLNNDGTYFNRPYHFPDHVINYIGKLSLADTAALLKQCSALVANDSGLMHLGVALGVQTFGIFGVTSPRRECFPSPVMVPITKGLDCESKCRKNRWGQRDCRNHLQCLKSLTAREVVGHMNSTRGRAVPISSDGIKQTLQSAYAPLAMSAFLSGGIGDLIIAGSVIKELHASVPNLSIDIYSNTPDVARFVFNDARFINAVHEGNGFKTRSNKYHASAKIGTFLEFNIRDRENLARKRPDFASLLTRAVQRQAQYRGLIKQHPNLDGFWGRIAGEKGLNRVTTLQYFACLPTDEKVQFFLSPDPKENGLIRMEPNGFYRPYITIHDGYDNNFNSPTKMATKCWPIDYWKKLVKLIKIAHPGLMVVQLGGSNSRAVPGVDHNLIGKTTLGQVANIIKQGFLHIDGDSGLVHIARAVHTKSVVIFGPTNADFFGYRGNANICSTECRDCWWQTPAWLSQCPRGLAEPACMRSIRSEQVAEAVGDCLTQREHACCVLEHAKLYGSSLVKNLGATLQDLFERVELPRVPISEHSVSTESGLYVHASKQWEYLFVLDYLDRKHLARDKKLSIADLGGGRGALAAYLAQQGHSVNVYDTDYLWDSRGDSDIEPRFRAWARQHGYYADYGSLFNVPAPTGKFDIVTSISVLEHVPHKQFAVKEALRILKPGGTLIMTFDFAADPARFKDSLRIEVFGPDLLAQVLAAVECEAPEFKAETISKSVADIERDRVLGIPSGMTVGGLVLRKSNLKEPDMKL
jgi:ADP-heptose:LPS heptosyltransferase/SAM-dependent methyltransferase